MNRKILMMFMSVLLAAGLPAVAQDANKDKLVFTPQWTAQAQFAGYYVALEKGFYSEAGLDVEIVHPSVTQPAMARMRKGDSHATTLQLCEAMDIVDDVVPLVNILQTSMNNGMVIVSRWGRIRSPRKGSAWASGMPATDSWPAV